MLVLALTKPAYTPRTPSLRLTVRPLQCCQGRCAHVLEDDALHARKASRRLVLERMQRATWQVPEAEEGWAGAWRKEGCTVTALPSKREASTTCHEPHAKSQTNQLLG